ncbi:MAG: hypothetical protein HOO96_30715 [Polyangiaceae bacterium]|nr:hypothetical protein [Polyangiaceae bacterium]
MKYASAIAPSIVLLLVGCGPLAHFDAPRAPGAAAPPAASSAATSSGTTEARAADQPATGGASASAEPKPAAPAKPGPALSQEEQKKLWDAFGVEAHAVDRALVLVSMFHEEDLKPGKIPHTPNPDGFVDAIREGKKLEPLAEACRGKYAQAPTYDAKSLYEPKRGCELATSWKIIVGKHAAFAASYGAKARLSNLRAATKNLEEKGTLYEHDQKALADVDGASQKAIKAWEPIFAQLGQEPPKDLAAGAGDLAQAWNEALKKASAVDRFPASSSFHDAEVEAAFRDASTRAGFTVSRVGLVANEWEVEKDGALPVHRKRSGHVLVRGKDESFCRIYLLTANADYVPGTGKFGKSSVFFDRPQFEALVSRCK